ncbi:MAG: hypothetical protein ACR2RL_07255 [Gammaproteobacteria bacterium]
METAQSIAKLGFRRWHERQLYESFAWLATCLLSGVAFASILEFVGFSRPGLAPYLTLIVLYVVGLMAVTTWRCFWAKLSAAQDFAKSAVCGRCDAYGLLDVMEVSESIPVRCRHCGNEWRLG